MSYSSSSGSENKQAPGEAMDTTADAPRHPRKAKAVPKSKPAKKDSKKKTSGAGKRKLSNKAEKQGAEKKPKTRSCEDCKRELKGESQATSVLCRTCFAIKTGIPFGKKSEDGICRVCDNKTAPPGIAGRHPLCNPCMDAGFEIVGAELRKKAEPKCVDCKQELADSRDLAGRPLCRKCDEARQDKRKAEREAKKPETCLLESSVIPGRCGKCDCRKCKKCEYTRKPVEECGCADCCGFTGITGPNYDNERLKKCKCGEWLGTDGPDIYWEAGVCFRCTKKRHEKGESLDVYDCSGPGSPRRVSLPPPPSPPYSPTSPNFSPTGPEQAPPELDLKASAAEKCKCGKNLNHVDSCATSYDFVPDTPPPEGYDNGPEPPELSLGGPKEQRTCKECKKVYAFAVSADRCEKQHVGEREAKEARTCVVCKKEYSFTFDASECEKQHVEVKKKLATPVPDIIPKLVFRTQALDKSASGAMAMSQLLEFKYVGAYCDIAVLQPTIERWARIAYNKPASTKFELISLYRKIGWNSLLANFPGVHLDDVFVCPVV